MNSIPVYVLGHDASELQRLQLQGEIIAPITRRLIRECGIRGGMRVLDIGCGAGDVSMLLAEAVGETGRVVGFDREARAIDTARTRAARAGLAQIDFVVTCDEAMPVDAEFDAAFGRYVLVHQPDPVALIRRAVKVVRPGGILAFHEVALHLDTQVRPTLELFRDIDHALMTAYRILLPHHDLAGRLVECFNEAGLPTPRLSWESIAGDHTSDVWRWVTLSYFSMLPHIDRLGLFSALDEPELLISRVQEAAASSRVQIVSRPQACAWAIKN